MSTAAEFFHAILRAAIDEIKSRNIPVYTFAFHHDHPGRAVSVCVDTKASSQRSVQESNTVCLEYFMEALADGDLKEASQWPANGGRSLTLADFAAVNIARQEIGDVRVNKQFHGQMIRAVLAFQDEIASLSQEPAELLLTCSGPDEEVEYVWSLPPGVQQ
ncbi:hypothetical protein [Janthinobacterium psychrotolerans]|uniref:Uncharacterized protein n=1 Tax=Janthinobacterium psychrotolerans TaxID=1747903 RepID=A0A1A7C1F9_9BURK|nr:hypothetical protein [Janthinobacterium psychrotolerans]OBV38565.1 hypothetical protein ASR47_1006165 [Janthinobacterium psychrotolerans]